jgi:chemotaxis-related protein WspB
MLALLLFYDNDRYAIDCKKILRVLPQVILKKTPYWPSSLAGLMNYGNTSIPIMDLSWVLGGRYSKNSFDTRIILLDNDKGHSPIGLIAENVTQAINCQEYDFIDIGIKSKKAPFLGGLLTDKEGTIQLILVDQLIEFFTNITQ